MKRSTLWIVAVLCTSLVAVAWAQQPRTGQGTGPQGNGKQGNNRGGPGGNNGKGKPEVKLPEDERLLSIHKRFVQDAEKLAVEYESKKELEKARWCYEEILRLVPSYTAAQSSLDKIKGKESSAEKKVFMVAADKEWQDTGVVLAEGKPFQIHADGKWTFVMRHELSADGIEIPEKLKDFNLGALVGVIDDGNRKEMKPFLIGSSYEDKADKTGKLLLQMYDADPSDNQGRMNVTISGTFYHPPKKTN